MTALSLILTIALIGVIVYCLTAFLPMPGNFKAVIHIIAIIVVLVLLLQWLGVMPAGFGRLK